MYCNELKQLQGCVVLDSTQAREKDISLDWLPAAPTASMILEDCGDSLTRYGAYPQHLPRSLK